MATTYDFNVTQGQEFSVTLDVQDNGGTPYNLSGDNGYKVSGIAKYRYSSSGALIDLSPSGVEGFLDSGRFRITLPGAKTQQLPVCQGVYGIEVYSGSGANAWVEKVINGKFNVFPEVITAGTNSFMVS